LQIYFRHSKLMIMEKPINLSLDLGNEWKNTSLIQEGVWNLTLVALGDRDRADAISMVSTELVENAVKYSSLLEEDENNTVHFSLRGDRDEVVVEVTNTIRDDMRDNIKQLDETIQWIRGYQNPWEAYIERLQEVSRSAVIEDSRMGMVRMAYEAGAILDFYLDEDNKLSVSATIPL